MEIMELNRSFWLDRPTFVTGGTGLVGSWLVKRLIDAGADVVCLVRDWVPQSEMIRKGWIEHVKVVRGDIRDRDTLERTLGEYEIDSVIHLAAQTIVTIANRNPISTFETNITGTWNPAIIDTKTAGTKNYTFTPDAGQCAIDTTISIEITDKIIPLFAAIGPYCRNTVAPSLPALRCRCGDQPVSGLWPDDGRFRRRLRGA